MAEYRDWELILGLVGAVGTPLEHVEDSLEELLKGYNYQTKRIRVSTEVIRPLFGGPESEPASEFDRIYHYMDAGDNARRDSGRDDILACGVAQVIWNGRARPGTPSRRTAYVIRSLKHPAEVHMLRELYGEAFYLVAVDASYERRIRYLTKSRHLKRDQAQRAIDRDASANEPFGQHTRETFQLADVFVRWEGSAGCMRPQLDRLLRLLFGHPYTTPTFDEYAMFLAFAAALRSADLSRQVGAVVARDREILAAGANDVPAPGGGLYWPDDEADCRDFQLGFDSNKRERGAILQDVANALGTQDEGDAVARLKGSRIGDITEYGRAVHAEMEALLSCARRGMATKGATLYTTTFPCHNCARHIIAAGIGRVVYVEPYPKSRALELHADAIGTGWWPAERKVRLEPFVGLGPRRFIDLFSCSLGRGRVLERSRNGEAVAWGTAEAELRTRGRATGYIDGESTAMEELSRWMEDDDATRQPQAGDGTAAADA